MSAQTNAPPRGLLNFFVNHPVAANMVMALMILFGVYGIVQMNTQFFPTLTTDRITISVGWSGASAEDVEANILTAIEPEVRFLNNVDSVSSYAREGSGNVILEFEEGTEMQQALSDVEQVVSGISILPEGSEDPKISLSGRYDRVAKIAIIGPFSENALKIFARKVRDDLIERGIDLVTFSGMRDEEYVINAYERDLRRLDISVDEVAQAIGANTRDRPSGNLSGNVEIQLRTLSSGTELQDIANLEVTALPTGESVKVSDIGEVLREFDSNQVRGFSENQLAIELTIQRALTADTLKTAAILDNYLEEVTPQLPKTLKLIKYEVSADSLGERISLLLNNGLTGLILVVVILFVFLNKRIAFWVAMGIPVAMLCTIGFMWVFGQTINMISLFALIMMLGVIVDDAIVIGEHTATRLSMGDSPSVAAYNGARKMLVPVLGACLTTISAFLPIMLIGDTIGQIMGVLPLVVICVVLASLVECFFVLPGHLSHSVGQVSRGKRWSWKRHLLIAGAISLFLISLAGREYTEVPPYLDFLADPLRSLRLSLGSFFSNLVITISAFSLTALFEGILWWLPSFSLNRDSRSQSEGWFRTNFDRGFEYFRDKMFFKFIRQTYNWRYITTAICIAAIIASVGLMRGGRVNFVFFPSPEAENISARLSFVSGISEEVALEGVREFNEALRTAEKSLTGGDENLIVASYTTLGKSGQSRGKNLASINVQLTTSEQRTVRTPEIVRAWRNAVPQVPGLKRFAISEIRGGPPGRDLNIQLISASPEVLKKAALEVQEILSGFPGVSGIADNLPYGKPELVMQLTPRGRSLGFTVDRVGQQIRNSFDGLVARRLAVGDEEIAIRVKQELDSAGSGSLRSMNLRTKSGEWVPLAEIVTIENRQGFSIIQREEGRVTVSVTADVDYDVTSNSAITEKLDEGAMQEIISKYGVDYRYSGRAAEQQRSFAELRTGGILALACIYLLLAGIFANYSRPIIVMSIIPFGIVGAIIGHYVMDYDLTILSMIGLLGLSGILVNNSIILTDRFVDRLNSGERTSDAAIGASCDRLRPVLLTSITTILGLTPLLFEQSVQAQFLKPMAITIVFGLMASAIIVLFLVPALIGVSRDISIVFRAIYGRLRTRQPTGTDLTTAS